MKFKCISLALSLILLLSACDRPSPVTEAGYLAFTGAGIFDGTGSEMTPDGILIIRNGRVVAAGSRDKIDIPAAAEIIDTGGKYIIPGLINSHGHVGDVKGIEPGHYSEENIRNQLQTYAWYGITSVMSLGGDRRESESFRAVNDTVTAPGRARLFIAGTIVTGNTPEEVDQVVDRNAAMGVDIIKIRVDDNLGTTDKMPERIYREVINRAHRHHLDLAAHLYYLEDARSLVKLGADFIAHSIRDLPVDDAFIMLIKERNVCYCPTLTRELSTFVYENTPDFLSNPFFLARVDSNVVDQLKDPDFQQSIHDSKSAGIYKRSLQTAMNNLKTLADSQVSIAMGTDTGVPARFPGYFEHLEMEMMAKAGMDPVQILLSATRNPAGCLGLRDVGTLEPGRMADFIILDKDPTRDIKNTKYISSVWIGGEKMPR